MDPDLPTHQPVPRPSVLFVCTANICRSPMAAALFRARLMVTRQDWRAWRVDSAGTWASTGQPAALEAQQVIARRGMDLSAHRSHPVSHELLRRFQLVLTMEAGQKEAILVEFPAFRDRVFMLSEMAGQVAPVQDPVGGTVMDFERAADSIDSWISKGIDRIVLLAQPAKKE